MGKVHAGAKDERRRERMGFLRRISDRSKKKVMVKEAEMHPTLGNPRVDQSSHNEKTEQGKKRKEWKGWESDVLCCDVIIQPSVF